MQIMQSGSDADCALNDCEHFAGTDAPYVMTKDACCIQAGLFHLRKSHGAASVQLVGPPVW